MQNFASLNDLFIHEKSVHRKRTDTTEVTAAKKYQKLTPLPFKSTNKPKKFSDYIDHKSFYPKVISCRWFKRMYYKFNLRIGQMYLQLT